MSKKSFDTRYLIAAATGVHMGGDFDQLQRLVGHLVGKPVTSLGVALYEQPVRKAVVAQFRWLDTLGPIPASPNDLEEWVQGHRDRRGPEQKVRGNVIAESELASATDLFAAAAKSQRVNLRALRVSAQRPQASFD